MRKLQKAAVVVAMIGAAGSLGAGTAFAGEGGPGIDVDQSVICKSHDLNLNVLSNIAALNGVLSGLVNQEGNNGETNQNQGSQMRCGAAAFTK
jgi:hypothetical protein